MATVDLSDEEWEHVLEVLRASIEIIETRSDQLVAALVLRSVHQKFIDAYPTREGTAMTTPTRSLSELLNAHTDELATQVSASAQGAALANLRFAAADLAQAEQQRNTLIVLARSVDCSLREIADATGLSPQGVSKIAKRTRA